MLKKVIFAAIFCLFFCGFSVCAETFEGGSDKVLIKTYTNFETSDKFETLINFLPQNGWHIYGPTVEDLGKPTIVQIDNKPNALSLPKFSQTQKFVFNEDIVQYGYGDSAFAYLFFEPSTDVHNLKISWLACKDYCEEEEAFFKLDATQNYHHENWENLISGAQKTFADDLPASPIHDISFLSVVIFAFFAGILLNFMPCIFPILSIKALYLAHNSKSAEHKHRYASALMYFGGVMLSFLLIAAALYILRSKGEQIGWGFQLQSPWFVGTMLALFFVIFLMFLDITKVPQVSLGRFSGKSSFLTGFFAVLIASPCSGPFMGMAVGYALLQPPYLYYPIFAALAAGYALPFSLADIFPSAIAKILPKSGKWLLRLKQILSVPILLTCFWLAWVLYAQLADNYTKNSIWQPYDEAKIETLVNQRKPVFINFTAKWCLTCLLNEKSTLSSKEFADLAKAKQIALFKADWTNKNPAISRGLGKFDRASVPLYVYYNNAGEATILPQILTPSIIKSVFEE